MIGPVYTLNDLEARLEELRKLLKAGDAKKADAFVEDIQRELIHLDGLRRQ